MLKFSSNLVFLPGFLMMKMEGWKKQRGQEGGRRRRTEKVQYENGPFSYRGELFIVTGLVLVF